MDISSAIISPNASIFITEFSQFGSLLDINNRIRQSTTKVSLYREIYFVFRVIELNLNTQHLYRITEAPP